MLSLNYCLLFFASNLATALILPKPATNETCESGFNVKENVKIVCRKPWVMTFLFPWNYDWFWMKFALYLPVKVTNFIRSTMKALQIHVIYLPSISRSLLLFTDWIREWKNGLLISRQLGRKVNQSTCAVSTGANGPTVTLLWKINITFSAWPNL